MSLDDYDNEISPCLECINKGRDKNHEGCVSCEERISYMGLKKPSIPKIASLYLLPEMINEQKSRSKQSSKKKAIAKIIKKEGANLITIKTKICSNPNCREEKPIEEFHRNKFTKDGRHSHCKDCRNRPRNLKKNEILLNLKEYPDLYEQIILISQHQIRPLEQQIIYIIKDWFEIKNRKEKT